MELTINAAIQHDQYSKSRDVKPTILESRRPTTSVREMVRSGEVGQDPESRCLARFMYDYLPVPVSRSHGFATWVSCAVLGHEGVDHHQLVL